MPSFKRDHYGGIKFDLNSDYVPDIMKAGMAHMGKAATNNASEQCFSKNLYQPPAVLVADDTEKKYSSLKKKKQREILEKTITFPLG